jgi:iron complex transport system ATP-binding protein
MTILKIEHAVVNAAGCCLLDGVSLQLMTSDFLAIIGPNGAGKTTLVRAALGLIKLSNGRITLDDVPVRSMPHPVRAGKLAWLPQRGPIAEPVSALEFVVAARFRFRESHANSQAAARRALASLQADALEARRITELSGGELQRVCIASLLAQDTPLLLLDEPASYLDPAQQIDIYELIGRLWRSRRGVLCITHDINALTHAIDSDEATRIRIIGLKNGIIEFNVTYDDPDLGEHLGALFNVQMQTVTVNDRRLFVARRR